MSPIRAAVPRASIKMHQIGRGTTIAVLELTLDPSVGTVLTQIFQKKYNPRVEYGAFGWQVISPRELGERAVEQNIGQIVGETRHWLAKHLPGLFVANSCEQLVAFPVLFSLANRNLATNLGHRTDPRSALGIQAHTPIVDPRYQNLAFSKLEPYAFGRSTIYSDAMWIAWGNEADIAGDLDSFPIEDPSATGKIAYHLNSGFASDTFLEFTIIEMIHTLYRALSWSRDSMSEHGTKDRAQRRHLKTLHNQLVTTSLDLAGIAEDVKNFAEVSGKKLPTLRLVDPPDTPEDWPKLSLNFTKLMRKKYLEELDNTLALDTSLREIATASSTIAVAVRTFRLALISICISSGSLFVALIAIARN